MQCQPLYAKTDDDICTSDIRSSWRRNMHVLQAVQVPNAESNKEMLLAMLKGVAIFY